MEMMLEQNQKMFTLMTEGGHAQGGQHYGLARQTSTMGDPSQPVTPARKSVVLDVHAATTSSSKKQADGQNDKDAGGESGDDGSGNDSSSDDDSTESIDPFSMGELDDDPAAEKEDGKSDDDDDSESEDTDEKRKTLTRRRHPSPCRLVFGKATSEIQTLATSGAAPLRLGRPI